METSNELFIQLGIVLGLSALTGYFVRLLKLPLIVAYLIAGVFLSASQLIDPSHSEVLRILPEMGVAFVLFFIGLELDVKEIKTLGKPIIAASIGQILFSLFAGYLIATLLGFPTTESLFLGAGLAVSSTIVVIKLLLEKKELNSLYGKLSIGILLIEDLVAIILLMMMTVGTSVFNLGFQNSLPLVTLLLKGLGMLILTLVLSRYVLARIFKAVAGSSELLFLTSVAWCFVFVSVAILLGFSVVIGAFLAGVALANSVFHYEIQGKVKPLRDFFVTLFFVYLGSQVVFVGIAQVLPLIAVFTLFALIIKPIIFMLILGIFGFKKHTLFHTAIYLSQISEFSLIIMIVGLSTGVVSQNALTAMALTGVLSIIASSIMIYYSRALYKFMSPFLSFFEHTSFTHEVEAKQKGLIEDHVILIGAHRIGGEIIKFLQKSDIPFLVLDFNPKVIQNLVNQKVHVLYGDIGDPEVLEFLNLEKAKLVISTAQDLDDNLVLLAEAKRRKIDCPLVNRASTVEEAIELYQAGSSYVILPEIVSGDHMAEVLSNHWPSLNYFKNRQEIELNRLSKKLLALE